MTQKISDISEFKLIEIIEKMLNSHMEKPPGLTIGMGDDTAVFKPESGQEILVTCDSMVEGRHFMKDCISPVDMGRRAMVMNISDIGAMGGIPLYAFVSLGLNPSTSVGDVEDIYKIVDYMISNHKLKNKIINIASNQTVDIISIVKKIEIILNKKAAYNIIEKGSYYDIYISDIQEYLANIDVKFDDCYIDRILSKYVIK